jgi:cysteinyl-tRNA synthetase
MNIYSTFLGKIEHFEPIIPGEVSLYACGVTTYDDVHIGHARQAIFFDVVRNYFEYKGYIVRYVRNYTDIDDKIIDRAKKLQRDPLELSNFYVIKTAIDLSRLKVGRATYEPKVSDYIQEIIDFISKLLRIGAAYVSNGEILFDVYAFPNYGKLSKRKLEDMVSDETVRYKKHPQDFSLWKKTKKGEPSWLSPWGYGRPGWHIECSVLAKIFLGDSIDIHGGGIDLIFPHHENEIAQSESFTNKQFAHYWLHNGLVMVEGQKMSKSLGNFITVEQALKNYPPDVIRFAILSFHYSSPIDFTEDLFKIASKRVFYFYKTLNIINKLLVNGTLTNDDDNLLKEFSDSVVANFESVMDADFNTALVVSQLSSTFRDVNSFLMDEKIAQYNKISSLDYFIREFKKITCTLRLLDENPQEYIDGEKERFLKRRNITSEYVEDRVSEREKAKSDKNFNLSDSIRQELKDLGIELHDDPTGVSWDIYYESLH